MKQNVSPPFLIIFGVGLLVVAMLVFLLASVGRGAADPGPMMTPVPITQAPTATPLPTSTPFPTSQPPTGQASPVPETSTPRPTPVVPDIAPDFTLDRSGGRTLTLSEQLAKGPAVLVFFRSGGG